MVAQEIDFEKLTIELKNLNNQPKNVDEDPTYFEIAQIQENELIASNILKFFFDPEQIHGFGTLFLESLLSTAGIAFTPDDIQEVEVDREVSTEKHNRIDLVVYTSKTVIGIENKLTADITNDLEDYHNYLSRVGEGKRIIAILLSVSLYKSGVLPTTFTNLTYQTFFEKVLSRSGDKLLKANSRYFSLFFEFIKSINNLKREKQMDNSKFFQWVKENEEEARYINEKLNWMRDDFNKKARIIRDQIDISEYKKKKIKIEQWIWDAFRSKENDLAADLVHAITVDELVISIETFVEVNGFRIELWERSDNMKGLTIWLSSHKIPYRKMNDGSFIYWEIQDINAKVQDVASNLQNLLDLIQSKIHGG